MPAAYAINSIPTPNRSPLPSPCRLLNPSSLERQGQSICQSTLPSPLLQSFHVEETHERASRAHRRPARVPYRARKEKRIARATCVHVYDSGESAGCNAGSLKYLLVGQPIDRTRSPARLTRLFVGGPRVEKSRRVRAAGRQPVEINHAPRDSRVVRSAPGYRRVSDGWRPSPVARNFRSRMDTHPGEESKSERGLARRANRRNAKRDRPARTFRALFRGMDRDRAADNCSVLDPSPACIHSLAEYADQPLYHRIVERDA